MRIANALAGRPQPYDRTPTGKVNQVRNYGVGPHASTQRWSYTVPSGRKFIVAYLQAEATRLTVATTPLDVFVSLQAALSGAGLAIFGFAELYGNVVDSNRSFVGGGALYLVAADIIYGFTSDGSTGGTVNYYSSAVGTEFDA